MNDSLENQRLVDQRLADQRLGQIESCCRSHSLADSTAGTVVRVRVKPRSNETGPLDVFEDSEPALRWGVKSAPTDGAANEELRASIAKRMKTNRGKIEIVKGHLTRVKSVFISGKSVEDVLENLN